MIAKHALTTGMGITIRNILQSRFTGVVLLVAILSLWEASAANRWILSDNWPRFSTVCVATYHGLMTGDLSWPLAATLGRAAFGFCIGSALGIVFGLSLGRYQLLDWAVRPWIEIQRVLPITAVVPAYILFFGVGDLLKVVVITIAVFSPVFVNVYNGVHGIDRTLMLTASTFGLSPSATVYKILYPAVQPSISAGMRIALSLALISAVIGEMITGGSGIGDYLITMQYAMRPEDMYAAVICLAFCGYALNRLFLLTEQRLLHWHFAPAE